MIKKIDVETDEAQKRNYNDKKMIIKINVKRIYRHMMRKIDVETHEAKKMRKKNMRRKIKTETDGAKKNEEENI